MRELLLLSILLGYQYVFGQTVADFSLPNAIDGSTISLSSYRGSKGVVVIFTSNSCPYSKLYEGRIVNLHDNYSESGLNIILINPNDPEASPEDDLAKMKTKARGSNYSFPYLADKSQQVSKLFGARKTPEVFLLKPKGESYEVIYRGAFDNNPQNDQDVSDPYLIKAIDCLLRNKPINPSSSRPVGCIIKT